MSNENNSHLLFFNDFNPPNDANNWHLSDWSLLNEHSDASNLQNMNNLKVNTASDDINVNMDGSHTESHAQDASSCQPASQSFFDGLGTATTCNYSTSMEVSSGRLGEASDTDDIPLSSDLGSPSLWPNWILSLSPPLPKDGIAAMAVSQADDPLDLDFKLNTNTNFEDLLLYSESAGLSPSSDWVLSLPDLDKVCSASGLDGLEDIAALFVSTCRFCGLVGCRTTILKEAARKIKITSRCPRVHRFSFAHALKPTNNQPSTSVPITCKLCEVEEETRCQPTYWKYALFAHIKQTHPQYWNNAENIPRNLPSYLVEKLTVTSEELALVHAKKMFSGPPIDPICRVDVLGTLPASLAKKPHMTK